MDNLEQLHERLTLNHGWVRDKRTYTTPDSGSNDTYSTFAGGQECSTPFTRSNKH